MPGLFGIVFRNPSERQIFKAVFDRIAGYLNFGNYELATYSGPQILLGNIGPEIETRIWKLETASGPLTCLINGQVYSVNGAPFNHNYHELFNYIIDSIESNNLKSLARINGQYNIALFHEKDSKFFFINDRFGFIKHFYTIYDNKLFFFPDFAALDALRFLPRSLNLNCLLKHIRFTYPDDDSTFLNEVKLFPNASIVSYDQSRGLTIKKYWDWERPEIPGYNSIEECADKCYSLMTRGLQNAVSTNEKDVYISLSGGLDSRFICQAAKNCDFDVVSASYGYGKSDECRLAALVAETLGTEHYHEEPEKDFVIKYTKVALLSADGMLAPYQYMQLGPIRSVMQKIYPRRPAHLSGFYGDGLLNAHFWNSDISEKPLDIPDVHSVCLKKATRNFSKFIIEKLFTSDLATMVNEVERDFGLQLISADFHLLREIGVANFVDRYFILTHGRRYLSSTLLFRFFGREILPFFDYDFFDFYLTIPPEFRLGDKLRSCIFLRNMADMAAIPYNKTGRPLPERASLIFNLKKKFFHELIYYSSRLSRGRYIPSNPYNYVQIGQWLKCLRKAPYIREILTEKRTRERGLFNPQGIVDLFSDFYKGKWTGTSIIKLFYLELWMRKYIDMDIR